ncbi:hypothetical protein [Amycolatopsis suaedae]|uniref:Glycosyltransferase RgtA/B/C/D-like domain-containing protein n=1 Tax=Amycolatopsis suaedae TaxID=2510978 RepID=A0A4Q7JB91_9PSEU|nr:hypothetical protein [Amycolatopsis suaedae]RZQ64547.1 hypothetical protein EWH70_06410 [Amycolatopsis suaedae]
MITAESVTGRRARVTSLAWAVLLGAVALGVHALRYGKWIVDDAGITFAYARMIASGEGPVLQPGAPVVEGFSNPTWLAVHVLGRVLGVFDQGGVVLGIPDYVLFPKAVAWLCCVGTLIACAVAARRVFRRAWMVTAVVGVALAANPSYVVWSFSGLENSLFAMAVCWLAVLLFVATLDGNLPTWRIAVGAGVIAAFILLTRPDGAIYVLAYPLALVTCARQHVVADRVRAGLLSMAVFVVPVGAYLGWRLAVFGKLLPNTATAKEQDLPGFHDVVRLLELAEYVGVFMAVAFVVLVAYALVNPSWWRAGLHVLLIVLVLGAAAFVILEGDWMAWYRFATPVWVLATLTAALLLARLATTGRGIAAAAAVTVLAIINSGPGFVAASNAFVRYPTVPLCYVANRFGLTFNTYAGIIGAERASLLAPDMGGTALTSRLELIDMAGLANAAVAERLARDDEAGLRDDVFDRWRPTFIHSRGDWAMGNGITSDPRMVRDYDVVIDYRDPVLPNGDWVRKDAVGSPAHLRELRDYAAAVVPGRDAWQTDRPLDDCGPDLHPGADVLTRR